MIDNLIKEFIALKKQEEELKVKKENLSAAIKEALNAEKVDKYTCDNGTAKIINKTTYSYDDETAIMNYIVSKGLSDMYLVKKINTTKFNTELKNKGLLFESVKPYITEKVSKVLEVK